MLMCTHALACQGRGPGSHYKPLLSLASPSSPLTPARGHPTRSSAGGTPSPGCVSLRKAPRGTSCAQWSGLRIELHRLDIKIRKAVREQQQAEETDREMVLVNAASPRGYLGRPCPKIWERLSGVLLLPWQEGCCPRTWGRSHSPRGQEPQWLRTQLQGYKPVTLAATG